MFNYTPSGDGGLIILFRSYITVRFVSRNKPCSNIVPIKRESVPFEKKIEMRSISAVHTLNSYVSKHRATESMLLMQNIRKAIYSLLTSGFSLPVPLLAVEVFMPEFFSISMSSQRNALMSCLISFTSSSVTPSFSALRCSTVTYRLTKFLMILWYRKSRSEACLTFRWDKNQKSKPFSFESFHYKIHVAIFYIVRVLNRAILSRIRVLKSRSENIFPQRKNVERCYDLFSRVPCT